LADAVGSAGASFELAVGSLAAVPQFTIDPADLKTHPAARAGQAAINVVRAREQTLDRAYFPHITVQSTFAARGTGAETPGASFGNGLWLQVPELGCRAMVKGARVPFTVPAYPGETFHGLTNLVAHDLDENSRTMAVELDVKNPDLRLSAGMYPEVQWPVRRPQPSLLLPPTSIVTTTERTFVVRVTNGVAQWVNVSRGARVGDLIEVFGALKEGDTVVRRGTDEIREGARVNVQPAKAG
jgi:multidrug efflux pump subunit AcrA (membrane-fusion protein)